MPSKKWTELDSAQHKAHAMRLLDGLDVIGRERRLKVARAILYMAQGLTKNLLLFVFLILSSVLSCDGGVWCFRDVW